MVNENLIPKVEEIREIKNEIPSYEEFMKTYKGNDKVSAGYDSEINSYGDLGVEKGYGPCSTCGNSSLTFKLAMVLHCWTQTKSMTVFDTNDAREEAKNILAETGHWGDGPFSYFSGPNRRRLADRINDAINEHINYSKNINRSVSSYE